MKMLMRGAHLHIFLCWNVINYYVLWWWMQLSMAGPPCLISYQKILRSKKWIGIPNFTFNFTPLSLPLFHTWTNFVFKPFCFSIISQCYFTLLLSLWSFLLLLLFLFLFWSLNVRCLCLQEVQIPAVRGHVTPCNLRWKFAIDNQKNLPSFSRRSQCLSRTAQNCTVSSSNWHIFRIIVPVLQVFNPSRCTYLCQIYSCNFGLFRSFRFDVSAIFEPFLSGLHLCSV